MMDQEVVRATEGASEGEAAIEGGAEAEAKDED